METKRDWPKISVFASIIIGIVTLGSMWWMWGHPVPPATEQRTESFGSAHMPVAWWMPWLIAISMVASAGMYLLSTILNARSKLRSAGRSEGDLTESLGMAREAAVQMAPIEILPDSHQGGQRFEAEGEGSDWVYQCVLVRNKWSEDQRCARKLVASVRLISGNVVRDISKALFVLRDSDGHPHCVAEVECLGATNQVELAICVYGYDYKSYAFRNYPFKPSGEEELALGRWECEVKVQGDSATEQARFALAIEDLNHPVRIVWRG